MAADGSSFVADQQNWQQRVKAENEAEQQWYYNWGSLYSSGPGDRKSQIEKLEAKLKTINAPAYKTNNMAYGNFKGPFKEITMEKTVMPKEGPL
mmetsp:Transcript_31300/g.54017  ORF Transcript_31300/g.54017 Transcript_31300/m.54017 type:complete len:94 (-) Transcript_31300:177-458(-)|eukprot:CAMPEP_0205922012 /NCGR_PEP_ID=MMETSP1325-20131115/13806_1 /ASSEMBLY_ACC=CAM_ASM_000708 /TAXON_ID=236786 /ORGANISM="Florenciella sp., Strain RCC1007" /LENGTH=93 /DNA_ID=CAMNT_0053289957 /DNA_START=131 /DNA_END=412 /DNA_ORIENTATION=+